MTRVRISIGKVTHGLHSMRLPAAAALLLLVPIALVAQMDQGVITGVVQDNTGAVIPGAQVTLTDTDTGITFQRTANASGIYVFPPTKVGEYKLTATSAGFRTLTQENIHLDIQDRLNIVLVLQPGAVSQTVTVSTAPPALQTDEASTGQVLSTRTIDNTPLNGRNWVYIAQLSAGVAPGNGSGGAGGDRGAGEGDFEANGQRPEMNDFILDGVDNNSDVTAFLNKASYNVQPPPDALAEFKVQTSDYSAEFGHSSGAVVNASIKSGTNQIHGSLWEYFRNDVLDARNFNALTIPKYRENQFGATLGLPILKDRLFFFGYSEANRIVYGDTNTLSVPTALMRQGNFSELLNPSLNASGQAITLYEPGSAGTKALSCNGQPNVICPNQIDPVAQNLLKLYPSPNANGAKLYSNYVVNQNVVDNTWQWGTRMDWNLSSKDQAFARFSYLNEPGYHPPLLGLPLDGGLGGGNDGQAINVGENFALSETHIFTPTLANEFRFGYSYAHAGFLQSNLNNDIAPTLGLGGIPFAAENGGLPNVALTELSSFGTPTFYPTVKQADVYQILDNVTKILGNHSLKAGVEFQSIRQFTYATGTPRGSYTYNDYFTSIPGKAYTGYGAADFLLNQMSNAQLSNLTHVPQSQWYRSAYVEDDWKVSPRLTLNLGLRYEYYQPSRELSGAQANFQVTGGIAPGAGVGTITYTSQQRNAYLAPAFTTLLAQSNVTIGYSDNPGLQNAPLTNFAPRLGVDYKLDDRTVIRAGFGLFYGGVYNSGISSELASNYPFQFHSTFPKPKSCKAGACNANGILLESGFQQSLAQGLVNYIKTPALVGAQQNVKTPSTASFNLTAERALSETLTASMGYVGALGRHLLVIEDLNSPAALIDPRLSDITAQPFPLFSTTNTDTYAGMSSYNSWQTRLEKRYADGLNFLATYTWSHSLDDAPPPLGSAGDSGYRNVNLIGIRNDYSNSAWDTRHRVAFNGLYELPFGVGKSHLNHRGVADALAGGWSADLLFTAQSGFPISIATDLGTAGPNGAKSNAILIRDPFAPGGTPDPSNPGVACPTRTRTLQHWYNPCAFANPPLAFPQAKVAGSPVSKNQIAGLAALPYLGGRRLSIPGPGYERINMSLFKDFLVYREQTLKLRVDAFNVLNTPAYGAPSTADNSSTGGLITAPRFFQKLTPDARFFQLSVNYSF